MAPHLLDSMIYFLTDGVIYYAMNMQQTIHARIQANGRRNYVRGKFKRKLSETMRRFEINDHCIIKRWERIYLKEGMEGLSMKRRKQKSGARPAKLYKVVGEDLIAGEPAAARGERLPKNL